MRNHRFVRNGAGVWLVGLLVAAWGMAQERRLPVQAIVDSVSRHLVSDYVFEDKALEMKKLLQKNRKKQYAQIGDLQELCRQLTADLKSVYPDGHLLVRPIPPNMPQPEKLDDAEINRREEAMARRINHGFHKMEILEGNVGYLDYRMFCNPAYAGKTAVAVMGCFENADALIIDLRQNGGGFPHMVQLMCSYFFEEPTLINTVHRADIDVIEQYWTYGHVEGPDFSEMPLYLLTSNYTFSAAEEFAYNLKHLERATLIGETTGGGAHVVNFRVFNDLGVILKLPIARSVNPVTQGNWEGTGVKPHIEMPASEALDRAHLEALTVLAQHTEDPQQEFEYQWVLRGLKAKLHPISFDEDGLRGFVGQYGPRRIWLEAGHLAYQREGRPATRLIPMGEDWFELKGISHFRIAFQRDASGTVTGLRGLYDNGREEFSQKQ